MPSNKERYIKKEAQLLKRRRQKGKKEMKDTVMRELTMMGFSSCEVHRLWRAIDTEAKRQHGGTTP